MINVTDIGNVKYDILILIFIGLAGYWLKNGQIQNWIAHLIVPLYRKGVIAWLVFTYLGKRFSTKWAILYSSRANTIPQKPIQ